MLMSRAILLLLSTLGLSGCPLFFDADSVTLRDAADSASADMAGDDARMPVDSGDGDDMRTPPDMRMVDTRMVDMREPEDMRDPGDMQKDVAIDMAPDLGPTGETCPGPHPDLPGSCNLVTQEPCSEDEVCEVVLAGGEPARSCRMMDAQSTYDLAKGDPCDPGSDEECQPHLFCRAGFCVAYCDLQNAFGCEPGEFCAPHDPGGLFASLGYCASACP